MSPRSLSAPAGEGVYIAEKKNGKIGRVDAKKVRTLSSLKGKRDGFEENTVWVRAPDGSEVVVPWSFMKKVEEVGGGWESDAEFLIKNGRDDWLLRAIGLEGIESHSSQNQSTKFSDSRADSVFVKLLLSYRGAIKAAVTRAVGSCRISREEGRRLLTLERCKFSDFTSVLRLVPSLKYVTSGEMTSLKKAEEKELIAWCEHTLSYIARLCTAQSRLGGRVPIESIMLIVDVSNLEYNET